MRTFAELLAGLVQFRHSSRKLLTHQVERRSQRAEFVATWHFDRLLQIAVRDGIGCSRQSGQWLRDPSQDVKHQSQRHEADHDRRHKHQPLNGLHFRLNRIKRHRNPHIPIGRIRVASPHGQVHHGNAERRTDPASRTGAGSLRQEHLRTIPVILHRLRFTLRIDDHCSIPGNERDAGLILSGNRFQ